MISERFKPVDGGSPKPIAAVSETARPDSDATWVLFGDESTALDMVTYGVVGFDSASRANAATFAFQRAIRGAGAAHDGRVHCKELFSGEARKRTSWAHLTERQTWDLVVVLIETLRDHSAQFYLGVVYKDTFPAEIPSGPTQSVRLVNEHGYAFGFLAAAGAFVHVGARRGYTRNVFLINEQMGKARFWGMGHIQIRRMMEATGLRPQPNNHLLLDGADIFAYAAARALSEGPARNKDICEQILGICRPVVGHYWCQAPGDEISPTMKKRIDVGSR